MPFPVSVGLCNAYDQPQIAFCKLFSRQFVFTIYGGNGAKGAFYLINAQHEQRLHLLVVVQKLCGGYFFVALGILFYFYYGYKGIQQMFHYR